ncbi:hypothetical protein [Citricoccus nitrophenolicus]|uniref:hypothetical protein n=1 Tax=Citricoccus nitrophenolicus TaxID=863575 RepID=UPI0039B588A2
MNAVREDDVVQDAATSRVEPGWLQSVPDPVDQVDEPARRKRRGLSGRVAAARARFWALVGVIVDRQLDQPLPERVQARVPEWMQSGIGRVGVGLLAVLVLVVWGIGFVFLAGLL